MVPEKTLLLDELKFMRENAMDSHHLISHIASTLTEGYAPVDPGGIQGTRILHVSLRVYIYI